MRVRKAVFPAAGWGTRFLPATKAQPKEMLPLVDKPVIQYAVEEAVAAGIEQVIIVTSSQKRAIEDHFDLDYELENLLEEKGGFAFPWLVFMDATGDIIFEHQAERTAEAFGKSAERAKKWIALKEKVEKGDGPAKIDFATLQLTLYNFKSQFTTEYNLLFMNILLITIPPLVAYLIFQRQIVSGMTQGAVKG